jgi:hypothetical protein
MKRSLNGLIQEQFPAGTALVPAERFYSQPTVQATIDPAQRMAQ